CTRAPPDPRMQSTSPAARRVRLGRCVPDSRSPADTRPVPRRSSFGLPVKVTLAIVGNEEGPNRAVGIICAEVALALVEPAELAIPAHRLQNPSAHGRIAQRLRQPQILLLRDPAELGPMLPVMLVELGSAAKAWAGRPQQQCPKKPQQDAISWAVSQ